jgi:hypothetical protein
VVKSRPPEIRAWAPRGPGSYYRRYPVDCQCSWLPTSSKKSERAAAIAECPCGEDARLNWNIALNLICDDFLKAFDLFFKSAYLHEALCAIADGAFLFGRAVANIRESKAAALYCARRQPLGWVDMPKPVIGSEDDRRLRHALEELDLIATEALQQPVPDVALDGLDFDAIVASCVGLPPFRGALANHLSKYWPRVSLDAGRPRIPSAHFSVERGGCYPVAGRCRSAAAKAQAVVGGPADLVAESRKVRLRNSVPATGR